jgi:hypothetical protein
MLTHLNWGASYLVHDFYRRFIRADADERHYVRAGRVVTVVIFALSSLLVFMLDTAKTTFDIILQIGAGTGLLYLVRWFWWRVNAWCEVVAMASSLLVSIALLVMKRNGVEFTGHSALVWTVIITTVCWVATAYLAPQTDRRVLIEFYRKVRPFGPGWAAIRREAGVAAEGEGSHIPAALLGWLAGTMAIWSSLFATGSYLYGRMPQALMLTAVFAISAATVAVVLRRLWPAGSEAA